MNESCLNNIEVDVETDFGTPYNGIPYVPQNYDRRFHGPMRLRGRLDVNGDGAIDAGDVADLLAFLADGSHPLDGEPVCHGAGDVNELWCVLLNCEGSFPKSLGYALRTFSARVRGLFRRCVTRFVVLIN